MELKIFIEKNNSKKKIKFKGNTLKELLNHLKINSETVIVTRNSEIITEDEMLEDKQELEILSVISGG